MSFVITYRPLCTVEILHAYFLSPENDLIYGLDEEDQEALLRNYDIRSWMQIEPTPETAQLLQARRIRFVQTATGFKLAVQAKKISGSPDYEAAIELDELMRLQFSIHVVGQNWHNYTNLPFDIPTGKIFYFSTETDNMLNDIKHLSRPLLTHDTTREYRPGALLVNRVVNPSRVFESTDQQGPSGFVSGNWLRFDLNQYASERDLLYTSEADKFSFYVAPVGEEELTIRLFDATDTLSFDETFVTTKAGVPLANCVLDLSELAEGRYRLEAEDSSSNILQSLETDILIQKRAHNAYSQTRPFGLIEVLFNPGDSGDYALTDSGDNHLLSPTFTLWWKNRTSWWRYYFEKEQTEFPQTPANKPDWTRTDLRYVFKRPMNELQTSEPKALTAQYMPVRLLIDDPASAEVNEEILLPNPSPQILRPVAEDGRVYSEIYVKGIADLSA